MKNSDTCGTDWESLSLEMLWRDAERNFCRLAHDGADGERYAFIPNDLGAEHPTLESVNRLAHEYELKDYLDASWALRPIKFVHVRGQAMLAVEYTKGEPLDRLIGQPMEIERFLRLASAMASALGSLHGSGLIHKDIKPSNVIADLATARIWFTGFGIASRLPRERQPAGPPEFVAGTLAYMAPEQTGRMNRSIDARSDLYALGVTLYEMLTGSLPFIAADAMEWVHCHTARQAVPPCERVHVSLPVSTIVMKLLAKTAEDRYQTATGLERDLRHCLAQFEADGRIDDFALGESDTPDSLLIQERLYGRVREIEILASAFDRIVRGGDPELVLVSGYSGVGKSAIVNEMHKVLVPQRGLFASGKFDQLKRDIPYATLAQALQSLVHHLLGKPEAELRRWRDELCQALDPSGAPIVELVPELKFIIGERLFDSDVPNAKARFQLAIRRLIGVFARPEHPLVLFLDDLQWLDAATLDLLEDLLVQPGMQNLLLVGAYRDNEVDGAHSLMRKLAAIRSMGVTVHEIVLAPLNHEDLAELIADALHCETKRAMPLAELVHKKTAGNPFFAKQFILELGEEGSITFDPVNAIWHWDLFPIQTKSYTDNVVDLMAGKLSLSWEHGKDVHPFNSSRNLRGGDPFRSLGGATFGADHPFGPFVPVRARPHPGGGIFAHS